MTPVVLGIDPGSRSLGLALVEFEPPHRMIWADTVSIDRPDGGWQHQQIAAALRQVELPAPLTRVAIEDVPYVRSQRTFKVLTAVATRCEDAAHRRWPWADVVWLTAGQWKKANNLKGKPATPSWLGQDARDAICIAVAGAKVELQEAA